MTEADEQGPVAAALTDLGPKSRSGIADAIKRIRGGFALALQSGVAAALAWFLAHTVIGRPMPFFAPIAAVITLASSMGQRLRLKRSFNIARFPRQARIVLAALQRYGMILADNGSSWYVSGVPDPRWSNDQLHTLGRVPGSAFEVVRFPRR